MSEKSQEALSLFLDDSFNCSQSVLAVFSEKYGLDKETAFKMASGLGGGIRCGELCGAVSGATQVIGLKHGQIKAGDMESKNNCYAKAHEFVNKFKEKYSSIVCRELMGHDVWTVVNEETKKLHKEIHVTICAKLVENAVKILEELGY